MAKVPESNKWDNTKLRGFAGETLVAKYLRSKGLQVWHLDHETNKSDLLVELPNGTQYEIEVKAHSGGYPTFCAEIYTNLPLYGKSKIAEYLHPDCNAKWIVHVDLSTFEGHVFDLQTFRSEVLVRQDMARPFKSTYGAAGILIPWDSKMFGYIKTIDLTFEPETKFIPEPLRVDLTIDQLTVGCFFGVNNEKL